MPYQPRATLDNPYGPQITFRTEDVLPPAALYISPEDRVTVWALTDFQPQTIYLQLRLLMPAGIIQLIPYQFAVQSTYSWTPQFEVPPWEGYLLGAMCWSSNPQRGQCFVSVQVMRSAPPDLQKAGVVLLQGYVNNFNVLSYPTSALESTLSGRGAFVTLTKPNQTGANIVVPGVQNTLWKLSSLYFTLNTSAAATNRLVTVIQRDPGGVTTGVWPALIAQAPSTGFQYTFAPGGGSTQQGSLVTIGAPTEVFVAPQDSLETFVQFLDAADVFTGIAARFEEWMGA